MNFNQKLVVFLFASFFLMVGCSKPKTKVDMLVSGERIFTGDKKNLYCEAFAVNQGKIIAVGTKREIFKKYSSEQTIESDDFIFPGLIDAHSHFYGYGLTLKQANLQNTFSLNEIIQKVVAYAQTSPEYWVRGRGWDQNDWIEMGEPNNTALNIYFPDRPVYIKRIDGHAAIANEKALKLAGITANTKVEGGIIEKQGNRLTGVLTDNAMELVEAVIPKPQRKTEIEALLLAQKNCFEAGLSCVCDAGLDLSTILLIDSLQKTGDLKIRVYAMANPSEENFDYFKKHGKIENDLLQVSSFKFYADGALGSRGARLKKPYCDHDHHVGVWVTDPAVLRRNFITAFALDFQANTHCIGDSANRKVLELYGSILNTKNDRRWRIEHSQVVTPSDRKLFTEYSIIPSVQPTHATSDSPWASDRICEDRMDGAYAYQSLLNLNQYMPLGTDFPVESISPLETFYAAVYRQNNQNKPVGGFRMNESLSPKQAMLGMTSWAAKANFMENRIGTIKEGMLADFVILNKDILVERYMLSTEVKGVYLSGVKMN